MQLTEKWDDEGRGTARAGYPLVKTRAARLRLHLLVCVLCVCYVCVFAFCARVCV